MRKHRSPLSLILSLAMSICLVLALSVPAHAFVPDDLNANATTEIVVEAEEPTPEPVEEENEEVSDNLPLTPDGNGNLADDSTSKNKEFITVQTKNGNYFYLILDKDRDSNNAYMLSQIDEGDLKDFIEEEEHEPVVMEPTVPEEPVIDIPEPVAQSNGMAGLTNILILAAAGGGGAFYYFKVFKPKQDAAKGEQEIENKEYDDDEKLENEDEGAVNDERMTVERSFPDDGDEEIDE